MTKEEIYEELKAAGVKFQRSANFISRETLERMYEEHCKAKEEIHLLRFADSGWCDAINGSYHRGLYRPATIEEYRALKPFATEVL